MILQAIARRIISIEPYSEPTDELQNYLNSSIWMLDKKIRFGFNQSALLSSALQYNEYVYPGERATLLRYLENIRINIFRKVERFTEHQSRQARTVINYIGRKVVERQICFDGDITVSGDFTVTSAERIENSFNKARQAEGISNELRINLENLSREIADLVKMMSAEQADQITRDLKILTNEVISENPRKNWYELSAQGLINAAKAIGEAANPIINIVRQILDILN